MNNMRPNQSFSVADIRRVREEDDSRRKNMTPKELADDVYKAAAEGRKVKATIKQKRTRTS